MARSEKNADAGDGTTTTTAGEADAANAQAQDAMDAITDKGYRGTVPDETPNENYTVAGVTSGAPTPETTRGVTDRVAAPSADAREDS